MKRKILPVATALILASLLWIVPMVSSYAQAQNVAEIGEKDEVFYGILDANGTVNSIYAVNQFTVVEGGTVTDYGNYASVLNLTTTEAITQSNGIITFDVDQGPFYYQGNLIDTNLPWLAALTYTLDGEEVTPSELAGKSGNLSIHLTTRQNLNVNPVFYENYMLQAAFSLGNDVFADIQAEGATIASAGQQLSVNFTVMPNQDADATITANVTNFHMDGVQISGLPFSANVDLSGTDDMIDDFSQLTDAIKELNNGVKELDLGAVSLSDNATKLVAGSSDLQDALTQLSGNSNRITDGSGQINSALTQIASSLGSPSSSLDMASIATLTQTLNQMADGLRGISGGLTDLNTGFQAAYQALDQAVMTIPDPTLSKEQINELYALVALEDPSQSSTLDALVKAYSSAATVKGTYKNVKPGFDAVGTTITQLSPSLQQMEGGLREIAAQIEKALSSGDLSAQIEQLATGLSQLSDNYVNFHNGLVSYMGGVKQLSKGYVDFQNGMSQYSDGMHTFQEGVTKLHDGTIELEDSTEDLPAQLQDEIDDMTADYSGKDFQPISFLSDKNNKVRLVQFVMKTADIELPEMEEVPQAIEPKETFWDRLLQLFTNKS